MQRRSRCKDAEVQEWWCRGGVQRHRCMDRGRGAEAEEQRSRGAEVQVQRCRDAEVQRSCRGADEVQMRCRGAEA